MLTNIVSVDIGYSNMALVQLDTDFINFSVNNIYKVNLKNFCENQVHLAMIKFIDKYSFVFDKANIILVERQPPQGLTNIQDILAFNYSQKVKLICPRSIHKYFMISKFDYDLRKKYTVNITNEHLKDYKDYTKEERKHDIADAFCQALYYIQTNKPIIKTRLPDNLENFFDSFKYTI